MEGQKRSRGEGEKDEEALVGGKAVAAYLKLLLLGTVARYISYVCFALLRACGCRLSKLVLHTLLFI